MIRKVPYVNLAKWLSLSILSLAALSLFPGEVAQASNSSSCDAEVAARIQALEASDDAWHQKHGSQVPSLSRKTRFIGGSSGKAILLLHGFISSPADMKDLTEVLTEAGHTVLVPLIRGFGAGPVSANASHVEDWLSSVRDFAGALHSCYPEISIVAHCLGAALATDVLDSDSRLANRVRNLVVVAPYYRTFYPGLNVLNEIFKAHGPVADLRVLRLILDLAPENVLPLPLPPRGQTAEDSLVPLRAIESALDLQKRFVLGTPRERSSVSVLSITSEADRVIDPFFAESYLRERFAEPQTLVFQEASGVPHYMHRRSLNSRFQEMANAIQMHVSR